MLLYRTQIECHPTWPAARVCVRAFFQARARTERWRRAPSRAALAAAVYDERRAPSDRLELD